MLEGRIDLAVHSFKDLPTVLPDGIIVAAVGEREDPRDALVGRGPLHWVDLPQFGVVATSSLRRRAQLLAAFPGLEMVELRGNVGTRLAKLAAGEVDAAVLAAAGLQRLGLEPANASPLPIELMVPAPGQGCLALQCRDYDE